MYTNNLYNHHLEKIWKQQATKSVQLRIVNCNFNHDTKKTFKNGINLHVHLFYHAPLCIVAFI